MPNDELAAAIQRVRSYASCEVDSQPPKHKDLILLLHHLSIQDRLISTLMSPVGGIDILELMRKSANATAGPWSWEPGVGDWCRDRLFNVLTPEFDGQGNLTIRVKPEDAEFIQASRLAMPVLVQEVVRLRCVLGDVVTEEKDLSEVMAMVESMKAWSDGTWACAGHDAPNDLGDEFNPYDKVTQEDLFRSWRAGWQAEAQWRIAEREAAKDRAELRRVQAQMDALLNKKTYLVEAQIRTRPYLNEDSVSLVRRIVRAGSEEEAKEKAIASLEVKDTYGTDISVDWVTVEPAIE